MKGRERRLSNSAQNFRANSWQRSSGTSRIWSDRRGCGSRERYTPPLETRRFLAPVYVQRPGRNRHRKFIRLCDPPTLDTRLWKLNPAAIAIALKFGIRLSIGTDCPLPSTVQFGCVGLVLPAFHSKGVRPVRSECAQFGKVPTCSS